MSPTVDINFKPICANTLPALCVRIKTIKTSTMSHSENIGHSTLPDNEKPTITSHSTESYPQEPAATEKHIHFVPRSEVPFDSSQDEIIGYDPSLMRARALLSSEEEKRVIRKIDWRLIPLLSVMYMVKSIDFTNVCFASFA